MRVFLLQLICLLLSVLAQSYGATSEGSTIDEPASVDLSADAKSLRNAMSGWGTDENTLIKILAHRSYNNRLKIVKVYRDTYSGSLYEDIKSETSGHFRTVLKGLVLPEARFLAEEMRDAMKGPGTNEDTLLLCLMLTLNDYDTKEGIKDYYQTLYNKALEKAIKDETSSPFKDFLVGVLNRPRFDESAAVDEDAALEDLSEIEELIEDKKIVDIVNLVTSLSLSRLAMLQEKYYQSKGSELYQALEKITDHHIKDGLVGIMSVATDYYRYCAYELHNAMDGNGTEEGPITEIIVTRADKDLSVIKEMYFEMFNKQLSKAIKDDTSGDYEKILLNLVN